MVEVFMGVFSAIAQRRRRDEEAAVVRVHDTDNGSLLEILNVEGELLLRVELDAATAARLGFLLVQTNTDTA